VAQDPAIVQRRGLERSLHGSGVPRTAARPASRSAPRWGPRRGRAGR
jgi:hypothetical protein